MTMKEQTVMKEQNIISFKNISREFSGMRVDKYLLAQLSELETPISRTKIQKLIGKGSLTNNKTKSVLDSSYTTKIDDVLILDLTDNQIPEEQTITPKDINLDVIYEDEHLAIINKPAGLTTHPGAGNFDDTLVNGLLYRFKDSLSNENGEHRPGIVHRLDKDTSGLMIIAKTNDAHTLLSQAIQEKSIIRKYLAYIYGVIDPRSGKIDREISRHKHNRLKMTTSKLGTKYRAATTLYKTLETFHDGFASMIECQLLTGRTHQIRVHLESVKHSTIGDPIYNSCKRQPQQESDKEEAMSFITKFPRQALHSYFLEFTHPITNEPLQFKLYPPSDMKELHKNLTS